MIALFIIFICLLSFVISGLRYGNVYNPLTIFSGLWCFIFILYYFNPYDLPNVKDSTLNCFFIGIFSFIVGCILAREKRKKNKNSKIIYDDFHNKRLIFWIQLFGTIVFCYLGSFGVIAILSGEDLTFIRYTLRLITLKSPLNGMLLSYIGGPIMYFSITYSCVKLAVHDYKKNVLFSVFFSIIMMLMELCTTGGRMGMFYTLTCAFVTFFENRKFSLSMGKKPISLIMLFFTALLFVGSMYMMAESRGGKGIEDLCVYLYGCIPCFDINKEIFEQPNYISTLGFLSFQGFIRPLSRIFFFSNSHYMVSLDKVSEMIDDAVDLNGRDFNSEVTMFGYFYFDGGFYLLFLFSFAFGFICQKLYEKFVSVNHVKLSSFYLYLVMMGNVGLSFLHFSFTGVGFALSIVLMYILKSHKKLKYEH